MITNLCSLPPIPLPPQCQIHWSRQGDQCPRGERSPARQEPCHLPSSVWRKDIPVASSWWSHHEKVSTFHFLSAAPEMLSTRCPWSVQLYRDVSLILLWDLRQNRSVNTQVVLGPLAGLPLVFWIAAYHPLLSTHSYSLHTPTPPHTHACTHTHTDGWVQLSTWLTGARGTLTEHCPSNCCPALDFCFGVLLRSVSHDLDYVLCTIFVYQMNLSEILSTGTLFIDRFFWLFLFGDL